MCHATPPGSLEPTATTHTTSWVCTCTYLLTYLPTSLGTYLPETSPNTLHTLHSATALTKLTMQLDRLALYHILLAPAQGERKNSAIDGTASGMSGVSHASLVPPRPMQSNRTDSHDNTVK